MTIRSAFWQYDRNRDFDNLHNELNDYKKFLELNLIDFNFDEEISNFFKKDKEKGEKIRKILKGELIFW